MHTSVRLLCRGLMAGSLLIGVAAEALAQAGPNRIDISSLPAAVVDDVVVPVPSEVFAVLDKLGTPNWKDLAHPNSPTAPPDRTQTALLLGTVIADGFIAVQAQDRENVKDIGRSVLSLAGAIGVRKSVITRSNSIIEAADQSNWGKVRIELDGALQDVKQAMVELRDEELAQLVSLGGWLRGTEALTSIVSGSYSEDGAELLHQPMLLEYFSHNIAQMEPKLRDNLVVASISTRLVALRPLIKMEDGKISKEKVTEIHRVTEEMVRSITSRPG